jgi:hypothetical protein
MIGYLTNKNVAENITEITRNLQLSRNWPVFWLIEGMPIESGVYSGQYFVPFDDTVINCPLIGNPIQTPQDFPEFQQMIDVLGDLDTRIDVPNEYFNKPFPLE